MHQSKKEKDSYIRDITAIGYNFLNLPQVLQTGQGNMIDYLYSASGVKLRMKHTTALPGVVAPVGTIQSPGGQCTDNRSVQSNNFYASGASMETTFGQPFKYNGKEFIEMHGYDTYDYGARGLHPAKMRFDTMDPLCEKYYSISPYAYALNNPMKYVDPDGRDVVYYDEVGVEISRITSDTRFESYVRVVDGTVGSVNCELTPVMGSFSQVTLSMSYTGDMSETNNKMSVGTLNVNGTDVNGNVRTLASYSADSGPSGIGSIPDGDYTASSIVNTSEKGMVRNGVGFKVTLTDNTEKCRTNLRIHPDGTEAIGTAGCVGLTESAQNLNGFRSMMKSFFKDGSTVNLNVSIQGNPNYSDCDENGKKKSKGGAAGN